MKVVNYSYTNIIQRLYERMDNCAVIQIQDPNMSFPVITGFDVIKQFGIPDLEFGYDENADYFQDIIKLKEFLDYCCMNKLNILVHCQAGVSRSGAVVEAAILRGYEDPMKRRNPNMKLLELLK